MVGFQEFGTIVWNINLWNNWKDSFLEFIRL